KNKEKNCLKAFFNQQMAMGKVSIFLDGLDEIKGLTFFKELCLSIKKFIHSPYQQNNFIISTRPNALESRFENFQEMEIAPLNSNQIEVFVKYYYGEGSKIKDLLRRLKQKEYRDLISVPLL